MHREGLAGTNCAVRVAAAVMPAPGGEREARGGKGGGLTTDHRRARRRGAVAAMELRAGGSREPDGKGEAWDRDGEGYVGPAALGPTFQWERVPTRADLINGPCPAGTLCPLPLVLKHRMGE